MNIVNKPLARMKRKDSEWYGENIYICSNKHSKTIFDVIKNNSAENNSRLKNVEHICLWDINFIISSDTSFKRNSVLVDSHHF